MKKKKRNSHEERVEVYRKRETALPSLVRRTAAFDVKYDERFFAPDKRSRRFLNVDNQVQTYGTTRRDVKDVPSSIHFENPTRAFPCLKRKQRREVVLAQTRGKGLKVRKARWKEESNVRCS